jgi:hypothetical protein
VPAASPPKKVSQQRQVVEAQRAVGADAVPGRAVAVGSHRDHGRRGLVVRSRQQTERVDTLVAQQVEQHERQRVLAHETDRAHLGTEPGQYDGGTARGTSRRHPDRLDQLAVGPVGDRLDPDHVGVEDVHADGGDLHGFS